MLTGAGIETAVRAPYFVVAACEAWISTVELSRVTYSSRRCPYSARADTRFEEGRPRRSARRVIGPCAPLGPVTATFARWNRKNGIVRLSSPASYHRSRLGDAHQHMSLHEIADGRDPNREHRDLRIDARSDGRSDRDGTRHVPPSNAGPDEPSPPDGEEPAGERGGQVSSLAVDDTDDGSASPDRLVAGAVPSERTVSLYASSDGGSTSKSDNVCIGMQSRMGRSRTERQSTRVSGATSDIAAWRVGSEGEDSEGHHPACAQTTGYLASRR